MTCLHPSGYGAASRQRMQAIVEHRFTGRQARFLALVMRHSGVCVPRQYAQVAGIAQGAKCSAFFERLVRHGHARGSSASTIARGSTWCTRSCCTTPSASPPAATAGPCRRVSRSSA